MLRLAPYKLTSTSGKALAKRLGVLRITPRQERKYNHFGTIINWGSSEEKYNGNYFNHPDSVSVASHKLRAAERFREAGVPQPDYTTDRAVAQAWLDDEHTVVERHLLRGHSGRGIVLVAPDGTGVLSDAPLYTKYIRKSTEFRVHVFGGRVIDYQEKKRRHDVPDELVHWQIRNHGNGFCYARSDVDLPSVVQAASILAVDCLGLDFGAVDIGYNSRRDKCRVYEVNTAPGLEGTTLEAYANALQDTFPQLRGGRYATRRAA
jgi:glutathione synthase/RimK-type ligase-like ATP-grasp enzyme